MAWMAIAMGVILCGVSVLLGLSGKTLLGRPLGGDFVEFYTIGKILNNYAPARIYDLELATGLQHAALPSMPETQMLVFGQAPFVSWLFRPFALADGRALNPSQAQRIAGRLFDEREILRFWRSIDRRRQHPPFH